MECLVVFLGILVCVTFFVRAAACGAPQRRRNRAYQQVARQFSGRYSPGGLFRLPTVRIRYGDTTAVLTEAPFEGPQGGYCTELRIEWADRSFRAEIGCQLNEDHLTEFNSLQTVKTGDAEFDRWLVVRCSDEIELRRFLSDGVRWQIIRLLELLGDNHLFISIERGFIRVQKYQSIRSGEMLKSFIEDSLALYDQAMITRAVGIEFVESELAAPLDHVICKVCGEEIEAQEMVYCQRCKTPHHGECWEYAGVCSVYGCMEKGYRRPQAASPTHPSFDERSRAESVDNSQRFAP